MNNTSEIITNFNSRLSIWLAAAGDDFTEAKMLFIKQITLKQIDEIVSALTQLQGLFSQNYEKVKRQFSTDFKKTDIGQIFEQTISDLSNLL